MDADEKNQKRILNYQETKDYTDPSMLGAYMGMGQTNAMNTAAGNTAGAVTGFAGLGMMGGMPSGMNVSSLMQQGAQQHQARQVAQQQQAAQQQVNPAQDSWTCSCGSVNTGKFCPNCGQSFPDPANPPKFCPNCGTKIG